MWLMNTLLWSLAILCQTVIVSGDQNECSESLYGIGCECSGRGKNLIVSCAQLGLTRVPEDIPTQVRTLNLANNAITSLLRTDFADLDKLRDVYLHHNNISMLENGTFSHQSELIAMSLADNQISYLPRGVFQTLRQLRRLTLARNSFTALPQHFLGTLDRLQYVDVSDNNITTIHPSAFAGLIRLQQIDLTGNPLVCDCQLKDFREWAAAQQTPVELIGSTCSNRLFGCGQGSTGAPDTTTAQDTTSNPVEPLTPGCFLCDGGVSNAYCNRRVISLCPGNMDACQTVVMFQDGALNITKGCTNLAQCDQDASTPPCSDASLTHMPVKCQLCCQGNMCNRDNTDGILQTYRMNFTFRTQNSDESLEDGQQSVASSYHNLISVLLSGHNASYEVQITGMIHLSDDELVELTVSGTIAAHTLAVFDKETIEQTVYNVLKSSVQLRQRGLLSTSIVVNELGGQEITPQIAGCYVCDAAPNNEVCNRGLSRSCGLRDGCQTVVSMTNGTLQLSKHCVLFGECTGGDGANRTGCIDQADGNTFCNYCCQGDYCNQNPTEDLLKSSVFTLTFKVVGQSVNNDTKDDKALEYGQQIEGILGGLGASFVVSISNFIVYQNDITVDGVITMTTFAYMSETEIIVTAAHAAINSSQQLIDTIGLLPGTVRLGNIETPVEHTLSSVFVLRRAFTEDLMNLNTDGAKTLIEQIQTVFNGQLLRNTGTFRVDSVTEFSEWDQGRHTQVRSMLLVTVSPRLTMSSLITLVTNTFLEVATTDLIDFLPDTVIISSSDTGATSTPTVTEIPITTQPITDAPETTTPVTDPPETTTPVTDAPETTTPVTDPPETPTPATDPPETTTPVTDPPETTIPVTDPPETTTPVTDPPETTTPVTDPPETTTPVTDPPETTTPVTDPPETTTPVTDPPETTKPVTDPPKTTTPVTHVPDTTTKATDAPAVVHIDVSIKMERAFEPPFKNMNTKKAKELASKLRNAVEGPRCLGGQADQYNLRVVQFREPATTALAVLQVRSKLTASAANVIAYVLQKLNECLPVALDIPTVAEVSDVDDVDVLLLLNVDFQETLTDTSSEASRNLSNALKSKVESCLRDDDGGGYYEFDVLRFRETPRGDSRPAATSIYGTLKVFAPDSSSIRGLMTEINNTLEACHIDDVILVKVGQEGTLFPAFEMALTFRLQQIFVSQLNTKTSQEWIVLAATVEVALDSVNDDRTGADEFIKTTVKGFSRFRQLPVVSEDIVQVDSMLDVYASRKSKKDVTLKNVFKRVSREVTKQSFALPMVRESVVARVEELVIAMCPPDLTGSEEVGLFAWGAEATGETSIIDCPGRHPSNSPKKKARRICTLTEEPTRDNMPADARGVWQDPDISACARPDKSADLDAINDMVESGQLKYAPPSIVNLVVRETKTASENSSFFSDAEVEQTVNILEGLASRSGVFTNHSAHNSVSIMNNLLAAPTDSLTRAETKSKSAGRFLKAVETIGEGVPIDGTTGKVQAVRPYFAMVITMLNPATFSGLGVLADSSSDKPFESDSIKILLDDTSINPSTDDYISFPRTLLNESQVNTSVRAQFILYQNDKLFKILEKTSQTGTFNESDVSTAHATLAEQDLDVVKTPVTSSVYVRQVNSRVLAATLSRVPVAGLNTPIVMKFSHKVPNNSRNASCVYWDTAGDGGQGQWSSKGCQVVESVDNYTVCACDHMTNFALLMNIYGTSSEIDEAHKRALTLISYIGCGISFVCLFFTIATYLLFRKLRRDNPSKILINLCIALAFVDIIFVAGMQDYTLQNTAACKAVAAVLHYFLLAALVWMLIEAFYMYVALVLVFKTYYHRFMLKCCLVGWGIPLVIVAITLGINRTDNYGHQTGEICWLTQIAFYAAFLAPVGLILLLNLIAFMMIMKQITGLSSKNLNRSQTASVKTRLRGAAGVAILLGLTWIFAIFAVDLANIVFQYLFAIFNSLQGMFIFIFYCLIKKDAQQAWLRCCCPSSKYVSSTKASSKGGTYSSPGTNQAARKLSRQSDQAISLPPPYRSENSSMQSSHRKLTRATPNNKCYPPYEHNSYSSSTAFTNLAYEPTQRLNLHRIYSHSMSSSST